MRLTIPCAFLGFALLGCYGCVQKSAKLQKSVVPPDKTLFETGSNYLKKGQYIKSRLAFQTLISTYPDSDMAAESYFAVADSFYEEGGTENLLQAEDQYKNFIVFFPTHPKAPDAQMKIIAANMKMMRPPDRDQQPTYKALAEIKKMLQQFPDSDYIPIAKQLKVEVEENLALSDLGVGQQYVSRNNPLGAKGRFQEIVDEYQDFSGMDDVYMRLANLWETKFNNPEQASVLYGKIVSGYPFSKLADDAKARLEAMGRPVPPVDTLLAALNQARLKPAEGFSPLKPFIDFGKALGFMGPPDRFDAAKKAIETEKAKTAEAAAVKPGQGRQTADDIQITTTLYKNASGETADSTIIGADPSAAPQDTADKKKNAGKTKRKTVKQPS